MNLKKIQSFFVGLSLFLLTDVGLADAIYHYTCAHTDGGSCENACNISIKAIDFTTGKDLWTKPVVFVGAKDSCEKLLPEFAKNKIKPAKNILIHDCSHADGGTCESACNITLRAIDETTGNSLWHKTIQFVGKLDLCQQQLANYNQCK